MPKAIAWIGCSEHRIPIDGTTTDNRHTVMRSRLLAGSASPVHIHPDEDETLIVIDGELVVWSGREKWKVAAADTAFLAWGIPHAYTVTADADLVTFCTPSGMERFFKRAGWDLAAGAPPADWSVTPDALDEAAAAGGQVMIGPPLVLHDDLPRED